MRTFLCVYLCVCVLYVFSSIADRTYMRKLKIASFHFHSSALRYYGKSASYTQSTYLRNAGVGRTVPLDPRPPGCAVHQTPQCHSGR